MSSNMIALDNTMLAKLDKIALSLQLSREMAIHKAITNFIEDIEFRKDVEAGLADVASGNVKPDVEVESFFAAKRIALKQDKSA